jgi:hypothetical protein
MIQLQAPKSRSCAHATYDMSVKILITQKVEDRLAERYMECPLAARIPFQWGRQLARDCQLVLTLQTVLSLAPTHSAGLCGEHTDVIETARNCHAVQMHLEKWMVASSISNHGHHITDGRIVACSNDERSGLCACGVEGH